MQSRHDSVSSQHAFCRLCNDSSDLLAVYSQDEARGIVLNILEKSGLMRSQQGNAIMLTVHGFDEEMKLEDISSMPHANLAKLYTVRGHALPETYISMSPGGPTFTMQIV